MIRCENCNALFDYDKKAAYYQDGGNRTKKLGFKVIVVEMSDKYCCETKRKPKICRRCLSLLRVDHSTFDKAARLAGKDAK